MKSTYAVRHLFPPLLCFSVLGCATGSYSPPVGGTPPEYERTVDKSFDETWTALIDYSSSAFFRIDRFEKASGLLTLTFGSTDPARFVDCGHLKAQMTSGAVDMPYAAYLAQRYGGKLDCKMNIVVRSLSPTKTLVRVNARYLDLLR